MKNQLFRCKPKCVGFHPDLAACGPQQITGHGMRREELPRVKSVFMLVQRRTESATQFRDNQERNAIAPDIPAAFLPLARY